ncbi:unnamed protein product [Fraxinus pennsylvanica]|uniref:Uncharacterized protein n=1 Tax=Fraxinus pennsylvanica TaxID=56036 RepID=A0AAD1YRR9_9LAMI|nr:unnamed protein product [Fraxinus pennsylvanica]
MLPPKVQMATSTFHKYFTDWCQSFMETNNVVDLFATMVSQTRRAFGIAIKAEALFKNLQSKNREFVNRTSQAKKAVSKSKAKAEAIKKRGVFECLPKLAVEALENECYLEAAGELNNKVTGLTKEVETEALSIGEDTVKHSIANFHLMEAYHSFVKYWRRYAYTKMVAWIKVNSQAFNTAELRLEFLEEGEQEPQTPEDGSHVIEIDEVDAKEASKAMVHNVIVSFVAPHPLPA